MFLFKKKTETVPAPHEPVEVQRAKRQTEIASKKALKSSKQLNKLLTANGITLQIYHATGEGHGQH